MLFNFDALWEYQFTVNTAPADPAVVTVPTADWLGPAPAPFGTIGASFTTGLEVATVWALNSGLWLRRALVVDGQAAVLITGQIENGCYIYLDGVWVGGFNPEASDQALLTGKYNLAVVIPKELLTEGTHELAVWCLDEPGGGGDTTFIYMEADYLPTVLPLWPKVPMSETIEWLTEVLVSEDGSETREELRPAPRHKYRTSYFVPPLLQRRVNNILYGAREARWLIPIWSQVQNVGAIAAGELDISADTTTSEFRPGGLAMLWQGEDRLQVVGIDRLASSSLLKLSTLSEAFDNAWIMPVKTGYLTQDPGRDLTGHNSQLDLSYAVDDNYALTVAAPDQYLDHDIYYDVSLLEGRSTTEEIVSRVDIFDEGTGLVSRYAPWLYNRTARVHRATAEDRDEAWAIREWLHRRAGRFRPFWQPSFEADLRVLNTGSLTTSLTVSADDFIRYASARVHIAVETASGWLPRAITDVLDVGEGMIQLTLDTSLAIEAEEVLRVSFLQLRRLNADRAELNWIGGPVCALAVPIVDIQP